MHDTISHHPLTSARPLFLNPDWAPFPVPPTYILGYDILLEYTFGQFGSSVPPMLPPSFFCKRPHWQGMRLLGAGLELGLNQKDRDLSMVKSAFHCLGFFYPFTSWTPICTVAQLEKGAGKQPHHNHIIRATTHCQEVDRKLFRLRKQIFILPG